MESEKMGEKPFFCREAVSFVDEDTPRLQMRNNSHSATHYWCVGHTVLRDSCPSHCDSHKLQTEDVLGINGFISSILMSFMMTPSLIG
mgnify:CR=1 FL=1